jgi:hypothetical protein
MKIYFVVMSASYLTFATFSFHRLENHLKKGKSWFKKEVGRAVPRRLPTECLLRSNKFLMLSSA